MSNQYKELPTDCYALCYIHNITSAEHIIHSISELLFSSREAAQFQNEYTNKILNIPVGLEIAIVTTIIAIVTTILEVSIFCNIFQSCILFHFVLDKRAENYYILLQKWKLCFQMGS